MQTDENNKKFSIFHPYIYMKQRMAVLPQCGHTHTHTYTHYV